MKTLIIVISILVSSATVIAAPDLREAIKGLSTPLTAGNLKCDLCDSEREKRSVQPQKRGVIYQILDPNNEKVHLFFNFIPSILLSNRDLYQNNFTALISNDYQIFHQWDHPSSVHSTSYLLDDSTLITPLVIDNPIMQIPNHAGGRFQKLNWDNEVIWDL